MPSQLLGSTDSANELHCREWRPDPRVGGAAVQMIYIPFHTQSTTYRATLTEENLPAMT